MPRISTAPERPKLDQIQTGPKGTLTGAIELLPPVAGDIVARCGLCQTEQTVRVRFRGKATTMPLAVERATRSSGWAWSHTFGWCHAGELGRYEAGIRAGHIQLELL